MEVQTDLNTDSHDDDDHSVIAPAHLLTDYIEIVYLPAAVCVGTILNLLVFRRLWRQWTRKDLVCGQRRSYLLLKFQLNIADFMVLLIYAFGRFCWVAAYQWYGGDFLCKAYHFFSLTAFHMTAFVVVTIALDRLRAVYSNVSLRNKRKTSNRFVRNMMITSWALALLLSFGQWFVWLAYATPFEVFQSDFTQCTTIWEASKVHNNTIDHEMTNASAETIYTLIHLLSAFWIPLLIIAIAYTLVCIRYLNHVLTVSGSLHRNASSETMYLNSTVRSDTRSLRSLTNNSHGQHSDDGKQSPKGGYRSRRGLRSQTKVFRTSGLVVLCYVCCWTPYNVLALWKVVDSTSFAHLSEQLNILNAFIVLNSVFNPLIYGFH